MADLIKLDCNIDEVLKEVESLSKQMNAIERKAVNAGGTYIASQVRKSYGQFFPNKPNQHDKPFKDPRNLKSSIRKRPWKKPKIGVTVWTYVHSYNPYNPTGPKVLYGHALAKGFTAEAKNDGYLTFQINGKWVKKKQVTITPRPFVTQPSERAVRSYELAKRMDEVIQKEWDKIEAKKGNYKVNENEKYS